MLVLNEDCFEVTLMVGMLIRLPHGTLGDLYSPINQQVAVSTAAGCDSARSPPVHAQIDLVRRECTRAS